MALKEILMGAAYALARAYELDICRKASPQAGSYSDQFSVKPILEDFSRGELPRGGQWLAGFYLNSAVNRIATGYERTLKILLGLDTKKHYDMECLTLMATKMGYISDDKVSALKDICAENNQYKHVHQTPINRKRIVNEERALKALQELEEIVSQHLLKPP